MSTLTMLELRTNSKKVLDRLARGESLVLTHRGKPVARLQPPEDDPDVSPGDPLLHLDQHGFDGPGGLLSKKSIDRMLYGA